MSSVHGKTLFSNSTQSVLNASAVYKGTWENVVNYSSVVCNSKSDVDGTLYIEFIYKDKGQVPAPEDTADKSFSSLITGSEAEKTVSHNISHNWFRARYVNGGSNQSSFTLSSIIGNQKSLISAQNEVVTGTDITYNGVPKHVLDVTQTDREGTPAVKPFFNVTHGFDMNKNGASGGTPEKIHNGTDDALWTASALSGTWDFASTTNPRAGGTKSIDATATTKDREALFEDATSTDMTNFVALTGWIYITAWGPNGSNNVGVRARLNGVDVGNQVNLSDYINVGTFNIYQKFSIPKADLGLTTQTVDELVAKTLADPGATPPDYFLDDIGWEQTGGPIVFEINPTPNTVYLVKNLIFVGVSTFDSRTTNPMNVKHMSYNKFFGQPKLTAGLISTTTINNVTTFAGAFLQNADFSLIPYTDIEVFGDGTTTWYRFQTLFHEQIRLNSTTNDNMQFIIGDDLSGMPFLQVFSNGKTEVL